jgi:hypothetical protein
MRVNDSGEIDITPLPRGRFCKEIVIPRKHDSTRFSSPVQKGFVGQPRRTVHLRGQYIRSSTCQ